MGLERVSPAVIHAMPQPMAGVRGYFVLGDGLIVGVIDPLQLIAPVESELRDALPMRDREPGTAVAPGAGKQGGTSSS